MRDVIEALLSAHRSQRPVVFTALIETRGSTPQKAGATMLIYEDGQQVGTLGGGCVEAEVKRRALECLATSQRQLETFQLDHDYGWDDGLICGGRMITLIDPVSSHSYVSYYEALLKQIESGEGLTQVVRIEENGANIPPGSRYLFNHNNNLIAQTDDHDFPDFNSGLIPELHSLPRPKMSQGWAYLPTLPKFELFIFGAGHVGKKVCEFASQTGFEVTVVDDREVHCNRENLPYAKQCLVGDFDEVIDSMNLGPRSFCIIVTRGHNHDEEALFHLIQKRPCYLGMIGSKRKIRLIFDDLIAQGIEPGELERVHAPIGLKIGSQTVPEIAISIVAELISFRSEMALKVESGK
ncbi:XdhC family protein [Thalassoglobus sp. JC818]|uniref:XdhC family protein n=1 Tax=Thalassoglobus sp. JC818 TaxID=3232136 RepID=UPI00345A7D77